MLATMGCNVKSDLQLEADVLELAAAGFGRIARAPGEGWCGSLATVCGWAAT